MKAILKLNSFDKTTEERFPRIVGIYILHILKKTLAFRTTEFTKKSKLPLLQIQLFLFWK